MAGPGGPLGLAVLSANETFHAIDLDDREHQLGVRLPDGGAVVLDLRAYWGSLVIYVPAEVVVQRVEGLDGAGFLRAPGPAATDQPR